MTRQVTAPDTEPNESDFPKPSEREHLLQVVENKVDESDSDVVINKIEVVGGEEEGRSLLHRVNTNDTLKSFYYCRMFLKAIGEPYKGTFQIDHERWNGRQFYASVVHNGKYANIKEYNFDKKVEQFKEPPADQRGAENVEW